MMAGEKVNVDFNLIARRARVALTRIVTMKSRSSEENAVGKLDGKVKPGEIGRAQFAKDRPVNGTGSGWRPILGQSDVGEQGTVEAEEMDGRSNLISDSV